MSELSRKLPCVLVVDDDADQLFVSRRMLEKAEIAHPIVDLPGGVEVMEYLSACIHGTSTPELPALVFLDLKMPVADGFAVLRWIRSQPVLQAVKVVMLTNSDDPEDVKLCRRLGAQGYLVKHPNVTVLACILREALGELSPPAVSLPQRE